MASTSAAKKPREKKPAAASAAARGRRTAVGIRPLGDRVIVRLDEAESKTPGGILLPDTAKEKPQRGEVVALGPDADSGVALNDRVLLARYTGMPVPDHDGLVVLRCEDLIAVLP